VTVRAFADPLTGSYRLLGESPLVEGANQFLRSLDLRGLSPRTVRAYAYDLVCLDRWLQGSEKQLLELTELDLLEFIAIQRDKGAKPRSINRRLTTAQLLFRFVASRDIKQGSGIMPLPNPRARRRDWNLGLNKIQPQSSKQLRVKVPSTLVEPLSKRQVRAFLRRLHRYRDIAIVYLMLLCGLRSREVRSVQLGDLNFTDHRLLVRGKGNKERVVPLPSTLILVVRRYLDIERPSVCSGEALFVVLQGPGRGAPMNEEALRKLFRYRRKQKDISAANAHRFRHTFGADMARARVRLPILQKLMGHSTPDMTMRYINLAAEDVVEEYERVIAKITSRYSETEK